MSLSGVDEATAAPMRCPTCGARQPWSDTCRRCRSDLGLLGRIHHRRLQSRRRALAALRRGRLEDALRHALQSYWLAPQPDAARLVAVCHLLRRNWHQALAWARRGRD